MASQQQAYDAIVETRASDSAEIIIYLLLLLLLLMVLLSIIKFKLIGNCREFDENSNQ